MTWLFFTPLPGSLLTQFTKNNSIELLSKPAKQQAWGRLAIALTDQNCGPLLGAACCLTLKLISSVCASVGLSAGGLVWRRQEVGGRSSCRILSTQSSLLF